MSKLTSGSRSVAGKVVLVTGAASGMGRATAHLFADEGAKVAVTDLSAEGVHAVVEEITGAGAIAQGWPLDVTDQDAVDRVVGEIVRDFGSLDILVNNAGMVVPGPVDGTSYLEDFQRTLDVDLIAHVRTIRAALPHLKKSGTGRIVNIASTRDRARRSTTRRTSPPSTASSVSPERWRWSSLSSASLSTACNPDRSGPA